MKTVKETLQVSLAVYKDIGTEGFMCCILDDLVESGQVTSKESSKARKWVSSKIDGHFCLSTYLELNYPDYKKILDTTIGWKSQEAFAYRLAWFESQISQCEV